MKKSVFIVMVVLLAVLIAPVFAGGQKEATGQTIKIAVAFQ